MSLRLTQRVVEFDLVPGRGPNLCSLPVLRYHWLYSFRLHFTMASTGATSTTESITNSISDAANYVAETAKSYTAGASKEGNKYVFRKVVKMSSYRPEADLFLLPVIQGGR